MKNRLCWWVIFLCAVFLLSGCNEGGSGAEGTTASLGTKGALDFSLDFTKLSEPSTRSTISSEWVITDVTVTLTRNGYEALSLDLIVADNVATGQVDNLDPGYWHVSVSAFQNSTKLFTGDGDVHVVAGMVTQCTLLFDPVVEEPTKGSIRFEVGLNPLPGYRWISHYVGTILWNESAARFYILDSSMAQICVYDSETLNRLKDILLPGAPSALALSLDGTTFYAGYPSGAIYAVTVSSGEYEKVADALMAIQQIVPFAANYILVCGPGSSRSDLKTINLSNGQIVKTKGVYDRFSEFQLNSIAKKVYARNLGVSPCDIEGVTLNFETGDIVSTYDSPYHGDFNMSLPLRMVKNKTRLLTGSGEFFVSSSLDSDDLSYAGNLGYKLYDALDDSKNSKIYVLSRTDVNKLISVNAATLFSGKTVALEGTPEKVIQSSNSVIVFVKEQGKHYMKRWSKADLNAK